MQDNVFKEKYKNLTPRQKEAVDTIDGPVMVIAGPGTGKTTILTLRIANILLKTDTPPSGILAITYTDAGVKAIKSKLREIIGSRAEEIRVHTFHSFAASIIGEFRDHFVHLDLSSQITDVESESLVRKILEKKEFAMLRPLGNPEFYISSILRNISEAKREALSTEIIEEFAKEKIKETKSSKEKLRAVDLKIIEKAEKATIFAKIFKEYEEEKKRQNKIDFDDLIFELIQALRQDKLLLQLLQEKFLYFLIDEHQDTNDSQNEIIKILADFFENPNVFIVGDEKQAIYRFQGASVANFLRFQNLWKDMKVIALEENFRSHQNILDASFSLIEQNYNADEHRNLRVKLEGRKREKPIDLILAPDIYSVEGYIAKEIKEIIKSDPDATIAIISRRNRDVEEITQALEKHGIDVSSERKIDIFRHSAGILFFSLIEFLNDSTRMDAFGTTVALGLWHLDFDREVEVLKMARAGNAKEIEKRIPAIKEIKKAIVSKSPIEFLFEVAKLSGFEERIASDIGSVEAWRGIISLSESIVKERNIGNSLELISALLTYKTSAEEKSIKIPVGIPEAKVVSMTAHGSKGLEFDYVFIPFATEESWVGRKRAEYFLLPFQSKNEDENIKDLRRLFYVSITRARKHVIVVVPEKDKDQRIFSPLRFIDELDKKSVKEFAAPEVKMEINNTVSRNDSLHAQTGKRIADYAKRVILENGLSVTALNHFLKCPSEFIWKSILKVPEAPSPTAERGNAMHKAFDRVWRLKEKNEELIAKTIKETVLEYFKNSQLPVFEKESITKDLLEKAPIVAKSLREHFNTMGEIHTEEWSEKVFDLEFLERKITFRIHGKLDALIDTPKNVFVFDYKTRGKMSVNEIKGNTKNSTGDYFRQLVFYKLLLEGNSKYKSKEIIPSLVFLTPDEKGKCHIETFSVSEDDIKQVKENIDSLAKAVWSGEITQMKCDDKDCEHGKILSL